MALKKQSNSIHTNRLAIRVSDNLLGAIKQVAKENEMSVSVYVREVLKQAVREESNNEKNFDRD